MNRRAFLRTAPVGIAAAPFAAHAGTPSGMRVSTDPEDRGYTQFCKFNGDNKTINVYLDGRKQRWVQTADEAEGIVTRVVETPEGNMARGLDRMCMETVYGDVRIEVVPKRK